MPVVFESIASLVDPTSLTTITVPKPAGTIEGDFLLALILNGHFNVGATWSQPSGWAELEDKVVPGGRGPSFTYAFLVAGDSEPADYTWINALTRGGRIGVIMRFSGVKLVNGLDAHANALDNGNVDVTCPSVITIAPDAMIVRLGAHSAGGTTGSYSPPAGYTERFDAAANPTNTTVASAHTIDVNQALAGATGAVNLILNGTLEFGNTNSVGITIALAPAPAGGGGIMGGDNPDLLQPSGERIERGQKILNPFSLPKRHCMCPIGNCTCV